MITGKNLVGGVWESSASEVVFKTVNPNTKEQLTTSFQEATSDQLSQAVEKASAAFEVYSTSSFQMRAQFLSAIQEEIKNNSNEILAIYQAESALPEGRAKGELQRTLDQIERFISLLNEGSFSQATIHTQGPDLRKVLFPIGPIVVFGASNFPLAFSTAGGDTISAFAAGCPVVVKAHPYHAGTSELVAQAIQTAIQKMKLPHGLFSHLGGESHAVGSALVAHPLVKGVGFTGSFKGGKALYDIAQKRSEPIPVFAEMGSVNPMFILENKLKTDGTLAADLASSITLGTGQFCTNPGLIVLCDPENKSGFIDQIRKEINEIPLPPMVHANIEANYHEHLTALETINEDVQLLYF
jgi:NADP-dependent aldehyde dehydrogenase